MMLAFMVCFLFIRDSGFCGEFCSLLMWILLEFQNEAHKGLESLAQQLVSFKNPMNALT